jgi:sugar/nucleoside kinase (ribokinase family)
VSEPTIDIIAIGNAIVDVLASADDAFLAAQGMTKGAMQLLDADQATALYAVMGAGREISGGSAANTLAGAASLGAKCAFIGQVATDQLGEVFTHDIRAQGVDFVTPAKALEAPTARCLILVSEDGQRTMNTYLGAAQFLPQDAIVEAEIASAKVLLLEGYLWDPAEPREAMKRAIRMAKAARRKVALGVSAVFCILNHRADFLALLDAGDIDILFANEEEVLALAGTEHFEDAITFVSAKVPLLVTTRGAERASVPAEPTDKIVDTTGAGDLFSAGFLAGHVNGKGLEESLRMGAIAAAEVISHWGARPEVALDKLVAEKMA